MTTDKYYYNVKPHLQEGVVSCFMSGASPVFMVMNEKKT